MGDNWEILEPEGKQEIVGRPLIFYPIFSSQGACEQGKHFLTLFEYEEASNRLKNGYPLSDASTTLLLNTVKGLDALKLFALLLDPECVVSSDITFMGLTLARSFPKDGYAFALHAMFEAAGDKLCRGGAEESACMAVDIATRTMYTSTCTEENLVLLKVSIHVSFESSH